MALKLGDSSLTARPRRCVRMTSWRRNEMCSVRNFGRMIHMSYWQKKELFHVKHRVFFRTLSPFQCAPESPPQGRRIYPAHVSTALRRSSRVGSMSRLVRLESDPTREDRPHSPAERPRVPRIPAKRSHIKRYKSRTAQNPAPHKIPQSNPHFPLFLKSSDLFKEYL